MPAATSSQTWRGCAQALSISGFAWIVFATRIGSTPLLAEHDREMRKTYEECDLIVSARSGNFGENSDGT